MYVTIDPGLDTGWALWGRLGLVACGLGDPRSSEKHVAEEIHDVWIESPVIYPRSKADPNDVLKLALKAGRWAGIYETLVVVQHFVKPADWKGQLSKDICHARMWARISEAEKEIVDLGVRKLSASKRHNVLDAVAFGVWVRETKGAT
jgi:hypothetical protein